MADCVSNAAELVKELKVCASDCSYLQNSFDLHNGSIMYLAADTIEALMQENAKLLRLAGRIEDEKVRRTLYER